MASAGSNFLECPLVIWVDTFRAPGSPKLQYSDLYNGVFLSDVMQQIDPRRAYENINRVVRDVNIRLQNWDILIKNIRAYYSDVLQQLLVVKLPNIQTISREPEKDVGFNELKKALLLVLGCAVQCERKEEFIDKIMSLELTVQHEIVDSIKQITDDSESILPLESPDAEKMYSHLTRLIRERDDYAEVMAELAQERDFYQAQAEGKTMPVSPTGSPEKHHMVVELTDCKAKIRKLRQELEEKQEQLSDVSDELEEQKSLATRLRNENVELVKDARSARSLRDEIDILREKMGKVNSYEAELLKYKEKLNEMDFYKARVEELREDNAILTESKAMLEEHLSSSHKRIETVVELEKELVKYRQQIEEMSTERDADRERIRLLAEENAQLQFHKKISMNESTNLEQEIAATKAKIAGVGGAISDQLNETTNAKILRLELENQHLHRKIEDMRENSLIENTTLNLELEKENQRLSKKVEKLQQGSKEVSQKCLELEEHNRELLREKEHFVQTVELTKESAERQIKELERQNDDLAQTVDVIRTRNEQTNDTKLKDLEKENKRLHETISVKNQHLSKLEFESRQLHKSYQRTKENSDKISELENEKDNLERENMDLKHTVQTQELICDKVDKLEQECSDLDVENKKLQRTIQSLQSAIQKKEKLEQTNINLTVENQKLQKMLENLKHSTAKVADVENENSLLKKELEQQQRFVDSKKSQGLKLEKMELDLLDLDNENMKLQRTLEITNNRVQQLEKDNNDLEIENEKLQEQFEATKYSQKRLSELEKENSELEQECMKLQKENSSLTKVNKRSKLTIESRESAIDELNTKHSMLEISYKELKRAQERQKDSVHDKEFEKEHRELLQTVNIEKQTVATLRADLVNEKIKTQELNNELEKFKQDLERLGVNKDQLVQATNARDDSRFKALENMMEGALKKSVEIKDEKIQALESRLDESKNRNLKLQEEVRIIKRECESLKQRYEEESLGKERERQEIRHVRNSPFVNQNQGQSKEIFEIKDHLVKVERNNATLLAENGNMKSQMNNLNEQIKKLESQNTQLHSHNSQMQGQGQTLQSQNAKLQVENSTLQSQCASLTAQNTSLQNQLASKEADSKKMSQGYKDMKHEYDQLLQDHETLQNIHDQSTSEYESLISEHGSLKSVHKSLKGENRDLRQQLDILMHGKDDENKMRDLLQREHDQLQMERKSLGNLQMDYNRLRDDHDRLLNNHSSVEKDNRDLSADNKRLKTELNRLQQDFGDCREKYRVTDTNFNMLANKYDSLYDNYQKTLEEKEQLMSQVELLIGKNQELLSHVLNSKDQIAGTEKSYLEQLADLRRQKERLEEKIMDHYKNREKQKKNKSFGAMLIQKMRGLTKNQRSKSRSNLAEGSPDSSSLGSGSFADGNDHEFSKKSDKRRKPWRRGSALYATEIDSPRLYDRKRGLAKSTTALNSSPSLSRFDMSISELRGARSTEDLLSDTLRSHGDSVSLSNSTFMLLPGMGRPTSDDEGGFKTGGRSPTGDMMTLEEFLAEGMEKSSPKTKRKLNGKPEDTESRSSDNSDNSARRRKPAPLPPTQLLNNQRRTGSVPDVVLQPDTSMSRMSRVSTGSSGSSQDIRGESAFTQVSSPSSSMQPNNTSTPARPQSQYVRHKQDDMNTSVLSRIQRSDDHRSPSGYDHVTSPHYNESPDVFPPPYQSNHEQGQYRDRPSPGRDRPSPDRDRPSPDRDRPSPDRDRLTADARLDLLTRGNPYSPTSGPLPANWSPSSSVSSPNQRTLPETDMSVRSAHSRTGGSSQGSWQVGSSPSPGQRPVKATVPAYARSHSPGRQPLSERNPASPPPTPQRKNILVSRAGPRPFEKKNMSNVSRARPASAFGAPVSSYKVDNSINSHLNNSGNSDFNQSADRYNTSDDSLQTSSNTSHHNGPVQMRNNTRGLSSAQRFERPKSVPPTMFNSPGVNDSETGYINSSNEFPPNSVTPPVPPPRKNRDILPGKYTILREPGPSTVSPHNKSFPSTLNTSMSPNTSGPLNNSLSSAMNTQHGARGPPSGNRIGPPPKVSSYGKPPAPKPMKPDGSEENRDPKENSIWYEYGCV